MTSGSDVIPPVDVWEKIVAPLAIGQEFLIELPGNKLIVQFIEGAEVIDRALGRILARRSGSHEKGPIARLREQKFARQLFEHTINQFARIILVRVCKFAHALRRCVQVRVDPRIILVDPHFEMAFIAPARCCRLNCLLGRVRR